MIVTAFCKFSDRPVTIAVEFEDTLEPIAYPSALYVNGDPDKVAFTDVMYSLI
jgi:hypothetical protein